MEEIPAELFEELDRLPAVKKPRKSKNIERNYRSWFYDIQTMNGDCSNPKCSDPRKKAKGVTMVWEHPIGETLCRYCFVEGWLEK